MPSRSRLSARPNQGSFPGELDPEARTATIAAVYPDRPAMSLHGKLAECEAETGRSRLACPAQGSLTEFLEDHFSILRLDPRTVVGNRDTDNPIPPFQADPHLAPARGKLECVSHQIGNHPHHHVSIAGDDKGRLRRLINELYAIGRWAQGGNGAGEKLH